MISIAAFFELLDHIHHPGLSRFEEAKLVENTTIPFDLKSQNIHYLYATSIAWVLSVKQL